MSIPPPRFQVGRPGYETAPVDAFIERVAGALEARRTRITSEDVRQVRFPLAQTRPGYAVADVDAWMAHVLATLVAAESARRAQPPSATPRRASLRAGRQPAVPDPGRHAVQEQPATPTWVRVTALLVIVGMIGLFVLTYYF